MASLPDDDTLLQALAALHQLGFFASHPSTELASLLHNIKSYHDLDWPDLLAHTRTPAAREQLLVHSDHNRVWCQDLECVYPGEQAYASTLRSWAALSRGAFLPEQITEHWQTEQGPVELAWTFEDQHFIFQHHDGQDDFLHHLALMKVINQSLKHATYRFVACDDYPGDCRLVTVLSAQEQQHLHLRHGWSFCSNGTGTAI